MMHRDPRQQRSSGNPVSPSLEMIRRYCNDWAVEIHGDAEMVDRIARRFGFINLGQVKKQCHTSVYDQQLFTIMQPSL